MTDHQRAMIGYGSIDWGASPRQREGRISRMSHAYVLTSGTDEVIRPYVMGAWPLASDQWGVAYPAGLVGVTERNGILPGAVGSYNDRWEAYWADEAENNGLRAVPGVLPGDYTPNVNPNWRSGADALERRWTADGPIDEVWHPSAFPWGYSVQKSTGSGLIGLLSDVGVWRGAYDGPTVGMGGWRKLQYKLSYTSTRFPEDPWTGSHVITLHRNADGSYPTLDGFGQPIAGDTSDHTASYARAAFTHIGGAVFETAWIDVGAVQSDVGVPTYWMIDLDVNGTSNYFTAFFPAWRPNSGGLVASFRLSPRLDIPFPVTHVGAGDLIAPGGYL